MDNNFILAESFHRANIQDRLYYVMEDTDKNTLKANESLVFGDKCWVIKDQSLYILGNDNVWYPM